MDSPTECNCLLVTRAFVDKGNKDQIVPVSGKLQVKQSLADKCLMSNQQFHSEGSRALEFSTKLVRHPTHHGAVQAIPDNRYPVS